MVAFNVKKGTIQICDYDMSFQSPWLDFACSGFDAGNISLIFNLFKDLTRFYMKKEYAYRS